jgi:hypothetical protein
MVAQPTNEDEASAGLTDIYICIYKYIYKRRSVIPRIDPDDGDRTSLRNVGF